jgi:hypothetical protein
MTLHSCGTVARLLKPSTSWMISCHESNRCPHGWLSSGPGVCHCCFGSRTWLFRGSATRARTDVGSAWQSHHCVAPRQARAKPTTSAFIKLGRLCTGKLGVHQCVMSRGSVRSHRDIVLWPETLGNTTRRSQWRRWPNPLPEAAIPPDVSKTNALIIKFFCTLRNNQSCSQPLASGASLRQGFFLDPPLGVAVQSLPVAYRETGAVWRP